MDHGELSGAVSQHGHIPGDALAGQHSRCHLRGHGSAHRHQRPGGLRPGKASGAREEIYPGSPGLGHGYPGDRHLLPPILYVQADRGAEHLLAPDPAFGLRRHVYLPDLPVSAGVSQGAGGGRICGGSQCIPGAVAYCGAVGEAGYCHPGLYHLFRPVQQLSVAVPGHQQK